MGSDRYKTNIECLDCGRKGTVSFVENDGWTFMNRGPERRIEGVSAGFTALGHGDTAKIGCDCGSVVTRE